MTDPPRPTEDVEGERTLQTTLAPLDPDNALAALADAARTAGLDAAGAELIRLGSNAVYRLRTSSVIGRVAQSVDHLTAAQREVQVARWLAAERVPAVRALDLPQPIVTRGRVVTLWESASNDVEYGTTRELAELLDRLHKLTPPFELPTLDPLGRIRARLNHHDSLEPGDRAFLEERLDKLSAGYDQLTFELPRGVIHGDANVGNVIRDRDGLALLADLDGFSVGPREWDLVLTALYYERFGWHTEREYQGFAEAYGFDMLGWPGYPVMRDVRELLMVTWLARNAAASRHTEDELRKRIHALRTDASRRDWNPF